MNTKFKIGDQVKAPGFGEGIVIQSGRFDVWVKFDQVKKEVEFNKKGKLFGCPEPILEKIKCVSAKDIVAKELNLVLIRKAQGNYSPYSSSEQEAACIASSVINALKEAGYLEE